ncbi:MAG TPA: DUF3179 domain-containing (seleno)protein [Gemmataceae bacterium]
MSQTPKPLARRPHDGSFLLPLLACGSVAVGVTAAYQYLDPARPRSRTPPEFAPAVTLGNAPFVVPGVTRPLIHRPDQVTLDDSEEVVGVGADGRHRAYVLRALAGPSGRVINDLIDGLPVTVTHCEQTRRTRVFTAPRSDRPLPISSGGLLDGELLLVIGLELYPQSPGAGDRAGGPPREIPYPDCPFTETTWGAWYAAHPDTDVYVGRLPGVINPGEPTPEGGEGAGRFRMGMGIPAP